MRFTDTYDVLKRGFGTADRYGNEVETFAEPAASTPGYLAPLNPTNSSRELLGGRDTVITLVRGMFPAGTDISAYDRVRDADGTVWAVDGEPYRARTRRGDHHVEVVLRSIAG